QALACADMASRWAGLEGDESYFARLVRGSGGDGALGERLDVAANSAAEGCAALASFLRETYAPSSNEPDPVGRERYLLHVRPSLGMEIDPEETYAWGW